ncbi:hypothetical protein AB1N83_011584 [Pleurotus pulmonarius]
MRYGSPRDFQFAVVEQKRVFASDSEDDGQVATDPEKLERHELSICDYHPSEFHDVVVSHRSTADIVKIVSVAHNVEGHTGGHSTGGICVDMTQMDAIMEIPLDPGPGATIGGMLSTGCSGTNAVRYGTARGEWLLNTTVALLSGKVIKTRTRARKSSARFDLTKPFVGAEGTLGIVTEVTIRLAPATEAVTDVFNQGVGIQCTELVDDRFMHATNFHEMSMRKWREKDSVFFKFQGPSPAALRDTAQVVKRVVKKHGGFGFTLAKDEKEAGTLWADRKNSLFSTLALVDDPDVRILGTDVCVSVSNPPTCPRNEGGPNQAQHPLQDRRARPRRHLPRRNPLQNAKRVCRRRGAVHALVERAIALQSTCTGAHGVGIGKKQYSRGGQWSACFRLDTGYLFDAIVPRP